MICMVLKHTKIALFWQLTGGIFSFVVCSSLIAYAPSGSEKILERESMVSYRASLKLKKREHLHIQFSIYLSFFSTVHLHVID